MASSACEFDLCDGSGWLLDEETNSAGECRCRQRLIARRQRGTMAGGLPKRYRGVSFDRPPVPEIERAHPGQVQLVRAYIRNLDANLDAGRGLWFKGGIGTGKTTLAMIVSKAAIEAGRTVVVYSLPRLLGVIRDSISSEQGMMRFLDRLAAVDLLHIDDLGAENRTDWVLEQLYTIVNSRYENERAMIVTTNVEDDDLPEQLGDRVVSRLHAICGDGMIPLYGQDQRGRAQELDDHRGNPGRAGHDEPVWGLAS
jgi:DNA replication protein DnaC